MRRVEREEPGVGSRESGDASLAGRTIALLESRRAQEAADLVRRYGGEPWSVPVMRELPLEQQSLSAEALLALCADGAEGVIFLTGVGTRALFRLASELRVGEDLRALLHRAVVAVRGPKPTAALRDLGIRIDRSAAEPFTSQEVLEALAGDQLPRVAVQLYGASDPGLVSGLQARGASVLELPVYRWALPEDLGPAHDFLDDPSRADALAVTSASQVHNLYAIAEERGQADSLDLALHSLVLAAVGPVAARSLEEHDLTVTVQPEHPSMGALIRELARYFGQP